MIKTVNTSRYIYAIFSGIPIGIILLVFGIKGVSLTEDKLNKKIGVVKELKLDEGVVVLKLKNETTYYHTGIPERVIVIKENINIGDKITIYKIENNKSSNYIEKLDKNGKTLIEFNKAPLVPIISLILGLIITLAGIIYLLQSFSDLFGGDKEKMNDFLDPWKNDKK